LTLTNEKLKSERETFEELAKFKEDRLAEDKKDEFELLVSSEFEDISQTDDFTSYKNFLFELVDKHEDIQIDAVKEKLYAIRGKLGTIKVPEKQKKGSTKVPKEHDY